MEHNVKNTFLVGVRGESFDNSDGTNRQEIIRKLKLGQPVNLTADPMNIHDRHAVAVFSVDNKQIGFLPSDARDSSSILRGEPLEAKIYKLTGGTNWFSRTILRKKYIGVVIKLTKSALNLERFDKLRKIAQAIDEQIIDAEQIEKSGDVEQAIKKYKAIINSIYNLTEKDRYTSAHRYKPAPINRLSLCLEKQRKHEEALDYIKQYTNTFDPIQPTNTEKNSIEKRRKRLEKKLIKEGLVS